MSGIEDSERMDEGDFADFLTETVFTDPNLESQVEEVVPESAPDPVQEPEEKTELPEPVFEDQPETVQIEQPVEPAAEEHVEEPDYAVWARKQFGEDLDLSNPQIAKIAESRYEAEKMVGRSQAELQEQRRLMEEESAARRIASLNERVILNDEESDWVDVAVESGDPAAYAVAALENERRDLYNAILDRWGSQGEGESARARDLHARVVSAYSQPPPDPDAQYREALSSSFNEVGLNIPQHGQTIMAKAMELGNANPYVQGMRSPNNEIRALSVKAVWDLAQSSQTTVQKVARDDDIAARVAEERLREAAAGVSNGTVHQAPPKTQGGFWDEFDDEIAARGWDGSRPGYKEQR